MMLPDSWGSNIDYDVAMGRYEEEEMTPAIVVTVDRPDDSWAQRRHDLWDSAFREIHAYGAGWRVYIRPEMDGRLKTGNVSVDIECISQKKGRGSARIAASYGWERDQ